MTRGEEVFTILQSKARSTASRTGRPTPTQEYLVRHLLESFLDRLVRSEHGDDFVLKGGILLAAYGIRRPTKDADANVINADVTPEHLTFVVTQLAKVPSDDGVTFDINSISVQEIRERAGYRRIPGTRERMHRAMEGYFDMGCFHRRSHHSRTLHRFNRPSTRRAVAATGIRGRDNHC